MARHALVRLGRLHVATLVVLGLTFALPAAATDVPIPGARTTSGEPGATTPVVHRPADLPRNPRTSANYEMAAALAAKQALEAARDAAERAAQAKTAAAAAARAAQVKAAARTVAKVSVRTATKPRTTSSKPARAGSSFSGRNRVWYPALGMSYSVSWFPCSRSRAPDNYVYRWGCAGYNNVYLMAHAWGKFRALNRAYYSGRLARGQLLVYADNAGRIHRYRLVWWRVYPPLTTAAWAWAPQSRPSATLQTCVGANNSLRLFVRFVEA